LAVTFLGPFTIVSLWLFSDVMRNRVDGRTPATMAKEFSHE
jgi:hypothetical protein